MSKQQSSVVGTVVLTVLVTSLVLVGGWFAFPRFFNATQPAASTDPGPVEAPVAVRKKTPRQKSVTPTASAASEAGAVVQPLPGAVAHDALAERLPAVAASDGSSTSSAAAATADVPRPVAERIDPPVAAPTSIDPSDARGIVAEAQRRSEAKTYRYDGLLETFDAKDHVSQKRWVFDREGSHGQSKSVIRFTAPAEVKGVALLIVNHPERASDQWMWTPAIERDRRVSLQDRSTRFFGTDFSFEDLEERDVEQFDYATLGDETIDGAACWKIQFTPKSTRSSQYSRIVAWIRKDNYAYARLDHYVKDEVVRRLMCSHIENVQGIWTARQLDMTDFKRATRTRLTLQQVAYNTPVKDEDFTLQAIRR